MVMQGTAEGNAVTLLGGSQAGDAYGGISGIGAAKGNTVTISGSTAENVYGGAAGILGTDSASIRSALKSSLPVLEYDEKNNDYYGAEIDPEVGYISGTTFENIAVVPKCRRICHQRQREYGEYGQRHGGIHLRRLCSRLSHG